MAFQYAYALDGTASSNIKDIPLDTTANYKTGAGTNDMKKGDLIFLSAGLARRATAATPTGTLLGVVEGGEFTGLAGAPYTAVNSAFTASITSATKFPNGMCKAHMDKVNVYRVPVNSGTITNANLGVAYNIILDAAGDQKLDITLTTVPACKVIDYTPDGKTAFVTIV